MRASEIVVSLLNIRKDIGKPIYFTYKEEYDEFQDRFVMTIELGTNISNARIFKQTETYKEDLDGSREFLYGKVLNYLAESMFKDPLEYLSKDKIEGYAIAYPLRDEAPEVSPETLKQLWDSAFPIIK